jgi:hypothetical protein
MFEVRPRNASRDLGGVDPILITTGPQVLAVLPPKKS